jgi:hypothetical protein
MPDEKSGEQVTVGDDHPQAGFLGLQGCTITRRKLHSYGYKYTAIAHTANGERMNKNNEQNNTV